MSNCIFKVKENLQTKSVFCEKLQQWVSSKYCSLCLNNEAASTKTTSNNIYLSNRYVPTYVRTYVSLSTYTKTKTKTHQNTPNPNLHSNKILLRGVLA